MESMPKAERLTRRERRAELGRELMDCILMRNRFFTGYPSELEQIRETIQKLEKVANNEEVSDSDDEYPNIDPPINPNSLG